MNGWQVFVGEKIDELQEGGMDFGEASKHLKYEWRGMRSEERQAYNEVGRQGVEVDNECSTCKKKFPSLKRKNEHLKSCGGGELLTMREEVFFDKNNEGTFLCPTHRKL